MNIILPSMPSAEQHVDRYFRHSDKQQLGLTDCACV